MAPQRAHHQTTRLYTLFTSPASPPMEALLQSGALLGGGRLDLPRSILDVKEAEALGDVVCRECLHQVALVGKHQQRHRRELILPQDLVQLEACLVHAFAVRGVHNVDERLGVLVIVAPVWANRLLPTNVPHIELEAVVHDGLDVEALRGGGGGDVLFAKPAENCRLTSIIQAEDQDTSLAI
eukprot:CAMPEP_0181360730 /NCGR_PEP_ID=MMETSP1106-20121128/6835_1 /TAXON_ID=81844 /ORGANISM="Mantoniella antarctica, Strain SL-175" /LENGTH=181 /DNA_ID=CAMNT_0023474049 /DNA_START=296 /DNA_END=842 /DNA_ORIENTATION=-